MNFEERNSLLNQFREVNNDLLLNQSLINAQSEEIQKSQNFLIKLKNCLFLQNGALKIFLEEKKSIKNEIESNSMENVARVVNEESNQINIDLIEKFYSDNSESTENRRLIDHDSSTSILPLDSYVYLDSVDITQSDIIIEETDSSPKINERMNNKESDQINIDLTENNGPKYNFINDVGQLDDVLINNEKSQLKQTVNYKVLRERHKLQINFDRVLELEILINKVTGVTKREKNLIKWMKHKVQRYKERMTRVNNKESDQINIDLTEKGNSDISESSENKDPKYLEQLDDATSSDMLIINKESQLKERVNCKVLRGRHKLQINFDRILELEILINKVTCVTKREKNVIEWIKREIQKHKKRMAKVDIEKSDQIRVGQSSNNEESQLKVLEEWHNEKINFQRALELEILLNNVTGVTKREKYLIDSLKNKIPKIKEIIMKMHNKEPDQINNDLTEKCNSDHSESTENRGLVDHDSSTSTIPMDSYVYFNEKVLQGFLTEIIYFSRADELENLMNNAIGITRRENDLIKRIKMKVQKRKEALRRQINYKLVKKMIDLTENIPLESSDYIHVDQDSCTLQASEDSFINLEIVGAQECVKTMCGSKRGSNCAMTEDEGV